jgi:MFS family permease
MYGYIFPKFLRSVNATPPEIGIVSTVLPVSMALTLLPGGILSDKGYRRKLVIASWLLPAFAPPFFMVAEVANSWLYALPGVVMFGSSWIGVAAVQSYTSEAAPKGKRGLSFGILVSSGSIGLIPSPLIGGLVLDAYGFTTLFLLAFILYAVSVVMVLAIPRLDGDSRDNRDATSGGSDASSKRSGMRGLGRTESKRDATMKETEAGRESSVLRRLAPMLALSCLFMGFVYVGWSYVPLYLTDQYGFDYQSVQLMSAVLNLSSMVIVNVLGKFSDRCSSVNRISLALVPVVSLVLAYWVLLSTSNIAYLSASFVLMGSAGAIFPLLYSVVGELSAGKRVGRTYGVIGTFIYAAEATTPYIGGSLYAASNQLPFILTLTLSPLLFIAVYIARRKTHQ